MSNFNFVKNEWPFEYTDCSYDLCTCDKIRSIKFTIFSFIRYEEEFHIQFSKNLNAISKHLLIGIS